MPTALPDREATRPGSPVWRWGIHARIERVGILFRLAVAGGTVGAWLLLPRGTAGTALDAACVVAAVLMRLAVAWALLRRGDGEAAARLNPVLAGADLGLVVAWIWMTGGAESRFLPMAVLGTAMPLRLSVRGYLVAEGAYLAALLLVAGGRDWLVVFYLAALASMLVPWMRRMAAERWQIDTDSLTGAFNHRYTLRHLAAELAAAARSGEPLGLLFCDLDGFKHINDTQGHAWGDAALRGVAAQLQMGCPGGGLVGRVGGDEFVVVLPRTPAAAAAAIAERLRAAVARQELLGAAGLGVPLTMSVGLAVSPRGGAGGDQLLATADASLYRAKERGGNAVGPWEPDGGAARAVPGGGAPAGQDAAAAVGKTRREVTAACPSRGSPGPGSAPTASI